MGSLWDVVALGGFMIYLGMRRDTNWDAQVGFFRYACPHVSGEHGTYILCALASSPNQIH